MGNLSLALWITALGMSLVFGVILLLWGLIIVIVRLGGIIERRRLDHTVEADQAALQVERQLAAVLAVAVALAKREQLSSTEEIHVFPLPPTAIVSPWQAVMRSKILNRRGSAR